MQAYYSTPKWGAGDAQGILIGEWGRLRQLMGWEFLFRGFLLLPLYELFGPVANLIQASLCAVAHTNKPLAEMYGSFPFALLQGYLARKSGSVWFCVYVHWLLGFSLQVYITLGNKGSIPFL